MSHASPFTADAPLLTLAPMQDVTDGAFWSLIHEYGGADIYWTEYFRVHESSALEKWIVRDIKTNATGKPVVAQMIGNDIPSLIRTAKQLEQLPIAAIDLNLGCPAPIVYRKCAGGGLLRDPGRIDRIVGSLRDAISLPFTVKTRLGFESPEEFDDLLSFFSRHSLDALTVHARTVNQQYRLPVYYERIRQAVEMMPCPVIANGHVYSAEQAQRVLQQTGARGLMIGRGAIRSPWLFTQIRQQLRGKPLTMPTGRDVLRYVRALWESQANFGKTEQMRCDRIKKFLYYFGADLTASFWLEVRSMKSEAHFHRICAEHFDHDRPMTMEPADLAHV